MGRDRLSSVGVWPAADLAVLFRPLPAGTGEPSFRLIVVGNPVVPAAVACGPSGVEVGRVDPAIAPAPLAFASVCRVYDGFSVLPLLLVLMGETLPVLGPAPVMVSIPQLLHPILGAAASCGAAAFPGIAAGAVVAVAAGLGGPVLGPCPAAPVVEVLLLAVVLQGVVVEVVLVVALVGDRPGVVHPPEGLAVLGGRCLGRHLLRHLRRRRRRYPRCHHHRRPRGRRPHRQTRGSRRRRSRCRSQALGCWSDGCRVE